MIASQQQDKNMSEHKAQTTASKFLHPLDTDACIDELFTFQAEKTPDAVAIIFEKQKITYSELEQRANQLAVHLQSSGVGRDTLVGLFVERSIEMIVAILGIIKAGGAYVPLDPSYPKDRLAFILEDTKASLIVTQQDLLDNLPANHTNTFCLDNDFSVDSNKSELKLERKINSGHLVYIIYTSGSTGLPKGVMITHQNLVHSTIARLNYYDEPITKFLLLSSFAFDSSVAGIFWTLTQGGALVLPKQGLEQDVQQLATLIESNHISDTLMLPSLYALLLEQEKTHQLNSLQRVIVAGEACPKKLVQLHYELFSQIPLYNEYGPTEATVWSSVYKTISNEPAIDVSIGKPIENASIYILDDQLQPTPTGVAGELYIGGAGVAKGYLNRPELTAEKFVQDHLSDKKKGLLYKTGDQAHYRADGNIEFLGRIDNQVKIRGYRIELGEIETALKQHSAIRESVVLAYDRRQGEDASRISLSGDKRLVAYAVRNSNEQIVSESQLISDLRSHLEERLPLYMMPSSFMFIDEMPLTSNGKVDRNAMPAPEKKRPNIEQAYVAPRTHLQHFLTDLWCEILDLDRIGIHDKFFELGGDSLLAAQFINRLQKELGESIFIVTIFDSSSIAEYATFLQRDYTKAVSKKFGITSPATQNSNGAQQEKSHQKKITSEMVVQMRECIPQLPVWNGEDQQTAQNPPAIFILAPSRSGTTLLRVMLAGHPGLFAASELQLLGFNTLKERAIELTGKFSLWLEGTIRTIMEIENCDVEEAKAIIDDYERRGYSTKQFFHVLQQWLGDKIILDKSPSYVLDPHILEKIERDFENALYIHLVRHPYVMTCSFERMHMDQVLFLKENPFSARRLSELVWSITHQNTLQFLQYIPQDRQFRICYENLVNNPQDVMTNMCTALGIDFHPNIVQPYQNVEKKMTDGIYKDSKPMGDVVFLNQQAINPKLAESWKGVNIDNFLSDITWELATSFGYEQPQSKSQTADRVSSAGRRGVVNRRRDILERRRGKYL